MILLIRIHGSLQRIVSSLQEGGNAKCARACAAKRQLQIEFRLSPDYERALRRKSETKFIHTRATP